MLFRSKFVNGPGLEPKFKVAEARNLQLVSSSVVQLFLLSFLGGQYFRRRNMNMIRIMITMSTNPEATATMIMRMVSEDKSGLLILLGFSFCGRRWLRAGFMLSTVVLPSITTHTEGGNRKLSEDRSESKMCVRKKCGLGI